MDATRFDVLSKRFVNSSNRRSALRLLSAAVLGALLPARLARAQDDRPDSDGDGLFDDDETDVYGTKPDVFDTDGDNVGDGEEIFNRDNGLGGNTDPLVNENAAPPPADPAPPAATCIALGGACSGIDQPCCGNDPATFGYNNVICCPTDLTGGSACTDIAGVFLCPDPAAVPPTGCPEGWTNCGGVCTNLAIDHGNCGSCGNSCGIDANCTNSTCVFYCAPGLVDCGGYCADLQTDYRSCGACGHHCGIGTYGAGVCQGGQCYYPTHF
jgi:hypothetical protein